jgi:hypothetical protein
MTDRSEITISLDAVRGEVSKFDRIGAGLADLERDHPKDVIYPVTNPDGMEQAVVARRAWREPRIALEHARKAAKAPILDLGRKIDAFAGDLEKKLREGEDHYDAQIKAEEGRKEAERQRRLQVEAERIAAVRRRIVEVFAVSIPPGIRPSSAEMMAMRARLEAEPVDDSYGDLRIEAQETKVVMLRALDEKIAEQRALEAQQAEVARQREAFLEEQRQETAKPGGGAECRAAAESTQPRPAERARPAAEGRPGARRTGRAQGPDRPPARRTRPARGRGAGKPNGSASLSGAAAQAETPAGDRRRRGKTSHRRARPRTESGCAAPAMLPRTVGGRRLRGSACAVSSPTSASPTHRPRRQ